MSSEQLICLLKSITCTRKLTFWKSSESSNCAIILLTSRFKVSKNQSLLFVFAAFALWLSASYHSLFDVKIHHTQPSLNFHKTRRWVARCRCDDRTPPARTEWCRSSWAARRTILAREAAKNWRYTFMCAVHRRRIADHWSLPWRMQRTPAWQRRAAACVRSQSCESSSAFHLDPANVWLSLHGWTSRPATIKKYSYLKNEAKFKHPQNVALVHLHAAGDIHPRQVRRYPSLFRPAAWQCLSFLLSLPCEWEVNL